MAKANKLATTIGGLVGAALFASAFAFFAGLSSHALVKLFLYGWGLVP